MNFNINSKSDDINDKVKSYHNSIITESSKEKDLDQFIISLESNYLTSDDAQLYLKLKFVKDKIVKLLGALVYLSGLLVIIIPIPSSYEIMTLIYFNPNDGLTVSDLIGLTLITFGLYMLIRSSSCKNK